MSKTLARMFVTVLIMVLVGCSNNGNMMVIEREELHKPIPKKMRGRE